MKVLKVKDNGNLAWLFIGLGVFPLFFVVISLIFNSNYIITSAITMPLLFIFFIFFFRNLIKNQEKHTIVADECAITLDEIGTFKWLEIESIYTEDRSHFGSKRKQLYLVVHLKRGKKISIDIINYDYGYKELGRILKDFHSKQQPYYEADYNYLHSFIYL